MDSTDASLSNQRLALDEAGFAAKLTVRGAVVLSGVIVALGAGVVVYGDIALPPWPQFVPLHMTFVFLLDAITAFLLFGQFHYRRLPLYLLLAGGYLFNAVISVPFLLAFPGVVRAEGGLIGGSQSSIWLWHYWHILFPAVVASSLVLHRVLAGRRVPQARLWLFTWSAVIVVIFLIVIAILSVTVGHDYLPVLIDVDRHPPLTTAFYQAGTAAAAVTLTALTLAWFLSGGKIALHLWLAVVMAAFLADVAASLGAHERYTVGWYFGRIEAMVAASVLLLVFLAEVMSLYQRLGATVHQLEAGNRRLVVLVEENKLAKLRLAKKNRKLERLSKIDYLTQLTNRQAIEEHIRRLIESAQRYGRPFSVLLIDIDYFKRVNDTYGHNVGDRVLRKLAAVIASRVRVTDTAARWGGEEFLVVCAETGRESAIELAEALRDLIAITPFGLSTPITASFGVAEYNSDEPLESLVNRADRQLYRAKSSGRNRVVAA